MPNREPRAYYCPHCPASQTPFMRFNDLKDHVNAVHRLFLARSFGESLKGSRDDHC